MRRSVGVRPVVRFAPRVAVGRYGLYGRRGWRRGLYGRGLYGGGFVNDGDYRDTDLSPGPGVGVAGDGLNGSTLGPRRVYDFRDDGAVRAAGRGYVCRPYTGPDPSVHRVCYRP